MPLLNSLPIPSSHPTPYNQKLILLYVESKKEMIQWIYLQNSNRLNYLF